MSPREDAECSDPPWQALQHQAPPPTSSQLETSEYVKRMWRQAWRTRFIACLSLPAQQQARPWAIRQGPEGVRDKPCSAPWELGKEAA